MDELSAWFATTRSDAAGLEGEAAEVAAAMNNRPFLAAERDPELFRRAVEHGARIGRFYRENLGWTFTVNPHVGLARLYKRTEDPPADRPPQLVRRRGRAKSAPRPLSRLAQVLVMLVCEQLWLNSETTFSNLQHDLIATCGLEYEQDTLPRFQTVALEGGRRAEADAHRRALVDALMLLEQLHVVAPGSPLENAAQDARTDMTIVAKTERLAALLACPPPSLLPIDLAAPDTHAHALCTDQTELAEDVAGVTREAHERHKLLRRIADDPVVHVDYDADGARPMASAAGRRLARDVARSLGLECAMKPGWWLVSDPAGCDGPETFPAGASFEQQAALLLLRELSQEQDCIEPLSIEEASAWIRRAQEEHPWWAKRYRVPGGTRRLAQAALEILTDFGLVTPIIHGLWDPQPCSRLWRVEIRTSAPESKEPSEDPGAQT